MKDIFYWFLFSVVICASPCAHSSEGADGALTFWNKSIRMFNSGKIDDAIYYANSLKSYNYAASQFLLTQYKIFDGMEHPESFGEKDYYLEMTKTKTAQKSSYIVDLDVSKYRGEYVASKVFSIWRVSGKVAAVTSLSAECSEWVKASVKSCVGYVMRNATGRYLASHSKMDAVYLYESIQMGWLSNSISYPNMSFGLALSLAEADPARSRYVFTKMESESIFSPGMKSFYCKFFEKYSAEQRVVNCDE